MQLHELQQSSGIRAKRRIGRGGKRGKTSGKGHKGQKSRAGKKIRPAERDIIKRIPKRRGHGKNRSRTVNPSKIKASAVNLRQLEETFAAGDKDGPKELVVKGLANSRAGRMPRIKILALGTLTKKLTIVGCELSATAKEAVKKAGGEAL